MVYFKESYTFPRFQEGRRVLHIPWGSNLFQGRGVDTTVNSYGNL